MEVLGRRLEEAQLNYKIKLDSKCKARWQAGSMRQFEYGEKAGALLAWKARVERTRNTINELMGPSGEVLDNWEEMQNHVVSLFSLLYREDIFPEPRWLKD